MPVSKYKHAKNLSNLSWPFCIMWFKPNFLKKKKKRKAAKHYTRKITSNSHILRNLFKITSLEACLQKRKLEDTKT